MWIKVSFCVIRPEVGKVSCYKRMMIFGIWRFVQQHFLHLCDRMAVRLYSCHGNSVHSVQHSVLKLQPRISRQIRWPPDLNFHLLDLEMAEWVSLAYLYSIYGRPEGQTEERTVATDSFKRLLMTFLFSRRTSVSRYGRIAACWAKNVFSVLCLVRLCPLNERV